MQKQLTNKMRMGTCFRSELLKRLNIKTDINDTVLDVGCFDGYWLSTQYTAKRKVGLDIDIKEKYSGIEYVKDSALKMPFIKNTFDKVFAFDVIEHVPLNTESIFISELIRVTKPKGQITITFPSNKIKLFPSFLTNYISKKWGHNKYNGLSKEEIFSYLNRYKNIKYELVEMNTKIYLSWYLILRFLWSINEKYATKIVEKIANMEKLDGENGYYLVKIIKN